MQNQRSTLLLIVASALMLSGPLSPLLAAGQEASKQGSPEPSSQPQPTATPSVVPPTELPPPDLVGRLMAPRIVQGESMASISGTISNRGDPVEGFVATITAHSGANEAVVWSEEIPGLSYGQQYPIDFDWAPALGLSRLRLAVDTDNKIGESDEENNLAFSWIQRSADQALEVAQPIRFEHAADRSQAQPESDVKWEGKRLEISVRPAGDQPVTVLVHKEWLDSRIETPALEGATFSYVEREGLAFYAFEVSTREWKHATWKPFDAGLGEQTFGWGSAGRLVLGSRPMTVQVVDVPRIVPGTDRVQTPNGSVEVDATEYHSRLSVDFSGESHEGQDVWVSTTWLKDLGISNPIFRHDDGQQVPARRVGDYYYLRPTHFSVIHTFSSSDDIWQVVNGQPNSEVSFDSPNGRMIIESQRADQSEESAIRTFVPHRQYTVTGRFGMTTQGNWQGASALAVGNAADRNAPAEDQSGARKAFGFFYYSRDDYQDLPQIEAYTTSASGARDVVWTWTAPTYEVWWVTLRIRVTGSTTFFELDNSAGAQQISGSRSNSALPTSYSDVLFFGSEDLGTDSWEPPTKAWVDDIKVTPQEGNFINEDFGSTSQWTLAGSAACCSGGYLQLTDNVANQVGRAIFNTGLVASRFSAEFRFSVGPNSGSSGADGMAFMFYKETAYTPAGGGRLGFQDSNDGSLAGHIGYGVTFDEWVNTEYNDFNGDDMAFVVNHVGGQQWWASPMGLSSGTWHTVNVEVTEGRIVVWYDDAGPTPSVFDHTFSRTYSGVGFSAGTGGLSNYHRLDYVRISIPPSAAANQPPTACFTAPSSVNVNQFIGTDASCSTDDSTPNADLQVRWDWEYASGWDTSYTTNKQGALFNGYSTGGTKTIAVQVQDGDGATHVTTRNVQVNSVNACINTPTVNGRQVSVTSCSNDPEGQAITHSWDWGDGSPASSGSSASHTYACPGGTYTITLTVTDSLGATGSTTRSVTTNEPDPDGDGLGDCQETGTYGTNPTDPDSDDDGLNDGPEVAHWNAIGPTAWQTNYNRYLTGSANNLLRKDADGDGLLDDDEFVPPTAVYGNCANIGGRNECPAANVRDVYVQVNWMVKPDANCVPGFGFCLNPGHSDRPSDTQIQRMRQNFDDWNNGRPLMDQIRLHLYLGAAGDGDGATYHVDFLYLENRPTNDDFGDFWQQYFPAARRGDFHFALFSHRLNASLGWSAFGDLFGSNMSVGIGGMREAGATDDSIVGAWMQEVGHNMMGVYHSVCNVGDLGGSHTHDWLNNPDAIHLTDEVDNPTSGGQGDEGQNDGSGCGIPDSLVDIGSHSILPNDAMGSGVTFATDSWLDFKPWKSLEFSGPPGPAAANADEGHHNPLAGFAVVGYLAPNDVGWAKVRLLP